MTQSSLTRLSNYLADRLTAHYSSWSSDEQLRLKGYVAGFEELRVLQKSLIEEHSALYDDLFLMCLVMK